MSRQYRQTIETTAGSLDIVHRVDENGTEAKVFLNGTQLAVPAWWLNKGPGFLAQKVCQLYNSASKLGVKIGG